MLVILISRVEDEVKQIEEATCWDTTPLHFKQCCWDTTPLHFKQCPQVSLLKLRGENA